MEEERVFSAASSWRNVRIWILFWMACWALANISTCTDIIRITYIDIAHNNHLTRMLGSLQECRNSQFSQFASAMRHNVNRFLQICISIQLGATIMIRIGINCFKWIYTNSSSNEMTIRFGFCKYHAHALFWMIFRNKRVISIAKCLVPWLLLIVSIHNRHTEGFELPDTCCPYW